MEYRFQEARLAAELTTTALAKKLNISQSTLSNWESGRRLPGLEHLKRMSDALGVSMAYLLGEDFSLSDFAEPISKDALPALHLCPVWFSGHGWAIVDSIEKVFIFSVKKIIGFDEIQEPAHAIPPAFSLSMRGTGDPLAVHVLCDKKKVWVEPISRDTALCAELRGWYKLVSNRLVENEFGNRFYVDTYGSKWLAFEDWE